MLAVLLLITGCFAAGYYTGKRRECEEARQIAEYLLFTEEAFEHATRWNRSDPRVMVRDLASAIFNKEYKTTAIAEKVLRKKTENFERFKSGRGD